MGSPPVIPNGEGAATVWTQIEKNNRCCVCGVKLFRRRALAGECSLPLHHRHQILRQQLLALRILTVHIQLRQDATRVTLVRRFTSSRAGIVRECGAQQPARCWLQNGGRAEAKPL